MSVRCRCTGKVQAYLPAPILEKLKKRAERNISSLSHEATAILNEVLLREEEQEQRQRAQELSLK